MKILKKISLIVFLSFLSFPVLGAEPQSLQNNERAIYIEPEMKLLNSYLKGLNTELKKPEPQLEQLSLLAQLIQDSARKIERTKENQTFHDHLKNLQRDAAAISRYSQKNQVEAALQAANSIKKTCVECHLSQLKK